MKREEIIDYENLFDSYTKCRRFVGWKPSVKAFVLNDVREIHTMHEKLQRGTWRNTRPKPIRITYPKPRDGLSIPFRDRVYQRSINDLDLYPSATRSFIFDNAACQKGKGTSFARRRIKQHLWNHFCHYKTAGWVLQVDIKSYYPTMDHETVFREFRRYVDPDVHAMVCSVLTDQYAGDKGFNPGSQMVQIAGISVLNSVDHFIKERLHCRHYIRYMDDFWILVPTKDEAERALEQIKGKLQELKFTAHPKKTAIRPLSEGFDFLGFRYRMTETGKVIMTAKTDGIRHERRKLRRLVNLAKKGIITAEKVAECYHSWREYIAIGNSRKLIARMDSYLERLWRES